MGTLWQDVRYGARMLTKREDLHSHRGWSARRGHRANTAIFSVVNAVLLRPLPFAESDRLTKVYVTDAQRNIKKYPTSYLNSPTGARKSSSFERSPRTPARRVGARGEVPESVEGVYVSADLFRVRKAGPALGRRSCPRIVARLAGRRHQPRDVAQAVQLDPGIVNRQVLFDGEPTTVVGVMPEGFRFPVEVVGPRILAAAHPQSVEPERGQTTWASSAASTGGDPRPSAGGDGDDCEPPRTAARGEERRPRRQPRRAARGHHRRRAPGAARAARLRSASCVDRVRERGNLTLARAAARSRESPCAPHSARAAGASRGDC